MDTLERLEERAGEVSNIPESHPVGYPKALRVHRGPSELVQREDDVQRSRRHS